MSRLERELELNGLEAPDEIPINTMTQKAPQQKSNKPRPTCHHCKNQATIKISAINSNERKTKRKIIQIVPTITTMEVPKQTNPNRNKAANNTEGDSINNQRDRRPRPVFPPCETCGRTNHSTENCYLGANAANRPPPRNRQLEGQNQGQQSNAQNNSDGNVQAAAQALN